MKQNINKTDDSKSFKTDKKKNKLFDAVLGKIINIIQVKQP